MSTLAEHVAAIEFYRANYDERETIRKALDMELWLLASAHLKEVAAMCKPEGLAQAREDWAARMRANYGDAAEPFIARWHAAVPRQPVQSHGRDGVTDSGASSEAREATPASHGSNETGGAA